jgi:DNA-binding GntR family transcriptional regulator
VCAILLRVSGSSGDAGADLSPPARLGTPGGRHRAASRRLPKNRPGTGWRMSRNNNGNDLAAVVKTLEDEIIFGRLRPRERLIEDELLARFAVKRHVVRQALVELERRGIVTKEPNKGAMVRDFTPEEVEHIYEMRELLHEKAVRRMPLPAPPVLIGRLREINDARTEAIGQGDLRRAYQLNDRFHGLLFEACGNPYLVDAIKRYERLSHPIRSLRMGDPVEMIAALTAGDRERLVTLCIDHVKPSKEAYLEVHAWAPAPV